MHALSGENAVMQWASGSSLRPFLDKLPDTLQGLFRQAYAEASLPHYPRRPDGTTLLPFQRLFIVVRVA
jgi:trans-aconitate 2-methyltransferase